MKSSVRKIQSGARGGGRAAGNPHTTSYGQTTSYFLITNPIILDFYQSIKLNIKRVIFLRYTADVCVSVSCLGSNGPPAMIRMGFLYDQLSHDYWRTPSLILARMMIIQSVAKRSDRVLTEDKIQKIINHSLDLVRGRTKASSLEKKAH